MASLTEYDHKLIDGLVEFVRKIMIEMMCNFDQLSGNSYNTNAEPEHSLLKELCQTNKIEDAIRIAVEKGFQNEIAEDLIEYEECKEDNDSVMEIKTESFYDFMEYIGAFGIRYLHVSRLDDFITEYGNILNMRVIKKRLPKKNKK